MLRWEREETGSAGWRAQEGEGELAALATLVPSNGPLRERKCWQVGGRAEGQAGTLENKAVQRGKWGVGCVRG